MAYYDTICNELDHDIYKYIKERKGNATIFDISRHFEKHGGLEINNSLARLQISKWIEAKQYLIGFRDGYMQYTYRYEVR